MKIKELDIMYLSTLSSEKLINEIYYSTGTNPNYAIQNFNRSIVKGLQDNGATIKCLSNPPIQEMVKSIYVFLPSEYEKNIVYKYIPYFNIPFLKHICILVYTFLFILFWGIRKRERKVVICDALCISTCMGALLASRLLNIKSVGLVTDIFSQIIGCKSRGFLKIINVLAKKTHNMYISRFSHYILLTEAMNDLVNPFKRPYMVMEGLCNIDEACDDLEEIIKKEEPKIILYAGGLYEKYGLKLLVDSVLKLDRDDFKLVLYGNGSYVSEIQKIADIDKRIKYCGVASNSDVKKRERLATLLINPRPTNEEFTKYSFPSKNLEYMMSGTPVLTTILPGMPLEYYPFVYLLKNETVEGFREAINILLDKSSDELETMGLRAKKFVISKKNNYIQAERIINFIELY